MFVRDSVWELHNLHWGNPIEPGTVIFNNTENGASGTLMIEVDGWYYVKIAGGGASSHRAKHDDAASGSGGAGFIGEVLLTHGKWEWQVGAKGVVNMMAAGTASHLLKYRVQNAGIIANPGVGAGHYPDPGPAGGILEIKNLTTRNVVVASNGNNGYAAGYGEWQPNEAQSVFKPFTGEDWGKGGSSSNDTARQGILYIEFRGV